MKATRDEYLVPRAVPEDVGTIVELIAAEQMVAGPDGGDLSPCERAAPKSTPIPGIYS
jgi:hypothetical protein